MASTNMVYFFTLTDPRVNCGESTVSRIYFSAEERNRAFINQIIYRDDVLSGTPGLICHNPDCVEMDKLHLAICCRPLHQDRVNCRHVDGRIEDLNLYCDDCYQDVKELDCLRIKYNVETEEAEFAPELMGPHETYGGFINGLLGRGHKFFHLYNTVMADDFTMTKSALKK